VSRRGSSLSLAVALLAACASPDRRAGDTARAAAAAAVADERPEWGFGEGSTRTDSLPKELNNLWEWGGYAEDQPPVAYAVDLNGDGREEWLVRAFDSECAQHGGCPMRLMTRGPDGHFVDLLDRLARVVYVTNHRVNGWPVLWTVVGGTDGGLFRLELRGNAYSVTSTLRRNRDTEEWTKEQMERDSLWHAISIAELR
jgi:hypothetical protein